LEAPPFLARNSGQINYRQASTDICELLLYSANGSICRRYFVYHCYLMDRMRSKLKIYNFANLKKPFFLNSGVLYKGYS